MCCFKRANCVRSISGVSGIPGGGGEMMHCPGQLVCTEEQGQHGEKHKKQGQVVEPVRTMTLVGRHMETPKENVERAMDARGMWRTLSKQ